MSTVRRDGNDIDPDLSKEVAAVATLQPLWRPSNEAASRNGKPQPSNNPRQVRIIYHLATAILRCLAQWLARV